MMDVRKTPFRLSKSFSSERIALLEMWEFGVQKIDESQAVKFERLKQKELCLIEKEDR